jgi:hypothetical protein
MLARFRRPKTVCCLSYLEYRPNKNIAILSRTGYTKEKSHMRGRIKEGS